MDHNCVVIEPRRSIDSIDWPSWHYLSFNSLIFLNQIHSTTKKIIIKQKQNNINSHVPCIYNSPFSQTSKNVLFILEQPREPFFVFLFICVRVTLRLYIIMTIYTHTFLSFLSFRFTLGLRKYNIANLTRLPLRLRLIITMLLYVRYSSHQYNISRITFKYTSRTQKTKIKLEETTKKEWIGSTNEVIIPMKIESH